MMLAMFRVVAGDVLAASADAILLPIDGTFVPAAGRFDRLLGTVGSAFLRRYPEADLLQEIEAQVDFPLPLGGAAAVELSDAAFRSAVLVSTLHHHAVLSDSQKRDVIRSALTAALVLARAAAARRVATPLLQGGWRLAPDVALREMFDTHTTARSGVDLDVYCLDPIVAARLQREMDDLARREGSK